MAFTLLKAEGFEVGSSLVEEGVKVFKSDKLLLPLDFICEKGGEIKVFDVALGIPIGWKGFDIGPRTIALFESVIKTAKTLFWNGPLGVFEDPRFAGGTRKVLEAVADRQALTIVGGGDSLAAVNQAGLEDKFSHLSTGGGASLELIEYGTLPGLEALRL